ncbi:phospholipase B1, membrane-associated isoform X1 [Halictus rubicundus]|uniref:phospholipase B1, membrane-associated isoform X1 n=1 Tax=Halictus rubicundus TaxID=77578 RepID=UPI004036F39C
MRGLRLLFILQLCTLLGAQRTDLDNPLFLQLYSQFRSFFFRAFGGRSSEVPTSVDRLRPGDIDIIGGMGDSLTAGNAIFAKNIFEIAIESRGASGSSGGQGTWRTYTTLPNILKEFNPKLIGYALGDSYTTHRASQFDVAEAGAMSRDMPFMAEYLVNRLRKDPRVDIKKDWKLITVMIGSNDFCINICAVSLPRSILDDHKKDLVKTLRILRDNLPRTIVALILPPHLRSLVEAQDNTNILKCYLLTRFECSCLFNLQFRSMRAEYYEIMESMILTRSRKFYDKLIWILLKAIFKINHLSQNCLFRLYSVFDYRWQDLEETIADYPEFHTNDFTVVALPSLENIWFPKCKDGNVDPSYFAVDCFHVTQKTNALYGNALWNNLLEPHGNKSREWVPTHKKFLCPTPERPFLMTRKNSRRSNNL